MNLREKLDVLGEEEYFKREFLEYVYKNFLEDLKSTNALDSIARIKKELPKLVVAHKEWELALNNYNLVLEMHEEDHVCRNK